MATKEKELKWYVYSSNNSGGYWWLKDEDWYKLEKSGWVVDWCKDRMKDYETVRETGRWLGALATSAKIQAISVDHARDFWNLCLEYKYNPNDEGCNCCGMPHQFYESWNDN